MPQKQKKDTTIKVADAKELVDYIQYFQEVIDEKKTHMPDSVYKDLTDAVYGLYCLEFYHQIYIISGGVSKVGAGRKMTTEQIRKLAKADPTKAINCENCNTPIMIRSYERHLQSQKCKDFHLTIKAAGGSVVAKDEINEKVIADYECGYCPPAVETGPEHHFPIGGASGLD